MSRGDLAGTRRDLERAKQAAPGYASIYMNLSVLDTTEGNLAQALADADEGVRLSPVRSLTHYYRGQVLERLKRIDDAAAEYRLALASDPRDRDAQSALDGLALDLKMQDGLIALYTRHDPVSAAARFRVVLDAMPTHYGATFQLARALDLAGRPAEALPHLAANAPDGRGDPRRSDHRRLPQPSCTRLARSIIVLCEPKRHTVRVI